VDWHRGEAASQKDNGLTDSLPALWDNIRKHGLQDKVVLHVGTSEQVLPKFRSMMFDFAFIDGDHLYDAVTFDIQATLPLMLPGSKIMFHDYTWDELGVKEAVDDMFPEVEVVNTSAIVQV
jgi:predicted O-methyltransferase YrrM